MKRLSLSVQSRSDSQKGTVQSKRLRKQGFVPAEIYGHNDSNQSVSLHAKEFTKQLSSLKGENALFSLQVEGVPEPIVVLVKEIQYGRMDHSIVHVDFLKVKMNEKIRVRVPVHILNADTCIGVKEMGTLQHFLRTIEVQCLPDQVPEHLTVDAAPLGIGASIHVSDMKAPAAVRITTDPQTVVVMVAEQTAEEKVAEPVAVEGAVAPVEGAAAVPGAEPEVLTAKKKEEGEAGADKKGADAKKPVDAKKPAEKSEKK
jgi:large subunit ribosomal protein L25